MTQSEALSLLVRPGQVGMRTRRIAILVADGIDGRVAGHIHESLLAAGATPRFVGVKMGPVSSTDGEPVEIEVSLEAAPPYCGMRPCSSTTAGWRTVVRHSSS